MIVIEKAQPETSLKVSTEINWDFDREYIMKKTGKN